ncbi:ribonuclease H [Streptomyces sp. NBC_00083]|uniref:ribonuclease H family protein n=1 Tax=Streptomyces sp. NBC_00083 TaxID=2975647 RepID=UPI0022555B2E|nr:ribonuclease H [Streptomyces sp. NBC_00083]MCX5384066.1 ribonuclease HI [Streptomyces sp. NBC_00083]
MSERVVVAACDGASKGNPGPAGWAWVIAGPQGTPERWQAGPLGTATNNVGELTALEQLLEAVAAGTRMQVRMDSQYAMKAVTQWLPGWKRNGWKTSAGKPVANRELVERIDQLLTERDVEFVHVAAHQVGGDPLNAIADQAASDAATSQRAAGTALGDVEMPVPAPARATVARSRPAARKSTSASGSAPSGKPRTIKAKFPGRCPCGQPYAAGTPIMKRDGGWGHPDCSPVA